MIAVASAPPSLGWCIDRPLCVRVCARVCSTLSLSLSLSLNPVILFLYVCLSLWLFVGVGVGVSLFLYMSFYVYVCLSLLTLQLLAEETFSSNLPHAFHTILILSLHSIYTSSFSPLYSHLLLLYSHLNYSDLSSSHLSVSYLIVSFLSFRIFFGKCCTILCGIRLDETCHRYVLYVFSQRIKLTASSLSLYYQFDLYGEGHISLKRNSICYLPLHDICLLFLKNLFWW